MRILAINGGPKAAMCLRRWADNGHETQSIALAEIEKCDAIVVADVILLDLTGTAVGDFAMLARHLDGKIVLDCSNPADVSGLRSSAMSIAEHIARACPGAAVVKALNVISAPALERILTKGGAKGSRGYIGVFLRRSRGRAPDGSRADRWNAPRRDRLRSARKRSAARSARPPDASSRSASDSRRRLHHQHRQSARR